jgi:SAM-dependent methyltransferase
VTDAPPPPSQGAAALAAIRRRLRPRQRLAAASRELAVRLGLLRRVTPIGRAFGMDRGGPIDRHYIDAFLARHRADIRGAVLEAGGFTSYTRRFGEDRVRRADVLYPKPGFPDGTLVGDLVTGEGIPSARFDCLIMTQVLPFVYDLPAAVATCRRALKPGGVLLATLPGIAQISRYDAAHWGDYWRFTDAAAARLFGDAFGPEAVAVETHGNVLAACAYLHGLSARDLTAAELDHHDPDFQLSITVRAVRRPDAPG